MRRPARRRLDRAAPLAFALALLPACGGRPAMPPPAPSALLEKPLPDFNRRTMDGSSIDTKSLRGRVVVVKFFAEYCAPCKKTLPAAEALARKRTDVAFVGIAEDERASTSAELVRKHGISFPVVHDQGQVLSGRYRVAEMPMTFVVSREGVVRWVGGAGQDESDLERAIDALGP